MLHKAYVRLQTLGYNIYKRKRSLTNKFLFKVVYRNTKKKSEIFLKLTIKTPELLSTIFCYFGHISHFFQCLCFYFEQVNVCWAHPIDIQTLRQHTVEIIDRCTKILVRQQLRKRLQLQQLFPKKPFSSCRLLHLIEGNNFFLSTVFLCFMKDESSWGQSSLTRCSIFQKNTCSYGLSIHNTFDRYFYLMRIFILKKHLHA